MNKFIGEVLLGFESKELYRSRRATAIFRNDEIVLEFDRHDMDLGKYTGLCKLNKHGNKWKWSSCFRSINSEVHATIKCAVSNLKHLELSGKWRDDGDPDSYDFEAEFEFAAS